MIHEYPEPPCANSKPAGKTIKVNLVLDESGSMASQTIQTIDAINEYVSGLRADRTNQYAVTLVKFADDVKVVRNGVHLDCFQNITNHDYSPRGMTALWDAVGTTIRLEHNEHAFDKILTIILTDGMENVSKEYRAAQVHDMIRGREATGRWTFVYLGAVPDAWAAGAGQMGLSMNNVAIFDGTKIKDTMRGLSRNTISYACSMNSSTEDFYGKNFSGVYDPDADRAVGPADRNP
jgi:hypothetical protein